MRSSLKQYNNALGTKPTWHSNCIAATGVARPGKTAKEKATGKWTPLAQRKAVARAKSQAERDYRRAMEGK